MEIVLFCFYDDWVNKKFFSKNTLVEEHFSKIKKKKEQISRRVGEDLHNALATLLIITKKISIYFNNKKCSHNKHGET